MNAKDVKNKLKHKDIDLEDLSISELKHLKNQAKSLNDKRIKRKCKSSSKKRWRLLCSTKGKSRKFLYRFTRLL